MADEKPDALLPSFDRDLVAMLALNGMLSHPTRYKPRPSASKNWHEAIAEEAYQIADAMLIARRQRAAMSADPRVAALETCVARLREALSKIAHEMSANEARGIALRVLRTEERDTVQQTMPFHWAPDRALPIDDDIAILFRVAEKNVPEKIRERRIKLAAFVTYLRELHDDAA